jgi:hypothetical protein
MGVHDDDFEARIKRVKVKSMRHAPMPDRRRVGGDDDDETAMSGAILRPQLALILGAVALIAGRAIAMNTLSIQPSTDLLGAGEGAVVIVLLFGIGLLFGKSDPISLCALVVGASLAFLGEGYYIPFVPDLMGSIYNPGYVALVVLTGQ